jgi:thioredoxin 1
MASANVLTITEANFDDEVLKSPVPVLLDFWAPWCGPCRMVSPIVEELSHEYGDQMLFLKMNTDENEETMINYGVTSIPTLIVFNGGRELNRIVGFAPKDQLKRQIDRSLSA